LPITSDLEKSRQALLALKEANLLIIPQISCLHKKTLVHKSLPWGEKAIRKPK